MPSRDRVIGILIGQTLNISFNFISPSNVRVAVDHSSFVRVGQAIESGEITLDYDLRHVQSGAGAQYNFQNAEIPTRWYQRGRSTSGVIVISQNDDPFTQGSLVHEAVHASFDRTFSSFPALENEAAAYIAGALYWKNINYNFYIGNDPNSVIFGTAKQIAENLPSGGTIPTADIGRLVSALGATTLYHDRQNSRYPVDG